MGDIVLKLLDTMTTMLNPELFSRENVEKLIRDIGEEEVMRVLAQLMEN